MMQEAIAANKRRSTMLLALMMTILVVLGIGLGELIAPNGGGVFGLLAALIVGGVQWGVYQFTPASVVMSGMNARKLEKADCPRLFNVVEEMQLASGLAQMPEVWLVDTPTPNAFAYSDGRGNAVVAATSGLLWRLNRDELQGVMAHEVAHVVHQDVRFMTLAGVILGSIVILSDMARKWFFYGPRTVGRSSRSSSGNTHPGVQVVIFLLVMIVVVAGPLMAQLLYFAISRKREYLADAAAMVYTRYPEGLASALEKLHTYSADMPGNRVAHAMCIVPPMAAQGLSGSSLFSTHPPTEERIAILRRVGGQISLESYLDASKKILGVNSTGLMARGDLASSPRLQARAPSEEGPVMERPQLRAMEQRAAGFRGINCSCGMVIRIPPHYERPEIRCIRCGTAHQVSSAQPIAWEESAPA
jgi:heat shock protein HtpX